MNISEYKKMLLKSKNMILHGAPGTGKTYLARNIAASIVSEGIVENYSELNDEQLKQIEFVQFHPSYDYTDFVEGLRPRVNDGGSMGFELKDGVFKKFIDMAREKYKEWLSFMQKYSQKYLQELDIDYIFQKYLKDVGFHKEYYGGDCSFKIEKYSSDELIKTWTDKISSNYTNYPIRIKIIKDTLASIKIVGKFNSEDEDESKFKSWMYEFIIYKDIINYLKDKIEKEAKKELKYFVFIIDEINRGEISKIFGELFFSIDPSYRGEKGAVSLQYSNMYDDLEKKFYIPENVYIIGTMNDIDRSVDSFDFAMRRRFRFMDIKANDNLEMIDKFDNDKDKMSNLVKEKLKSLNDAIADKKNGLDERYQVGAAYFLKLYEISEDELWSDYLEPLLKEYVRGMNDEEYVMKNFKSAYDEIKLENNSNINENVETNDTNAINKDDTIENNDVANEDLW